jgi:low temperature requirement protein LtrA
MSLFAAKINYLRPREGHGNAPVAQIELFFDLVFVFTVTQLSEELRTHLTALGLLESAMLVAAIWWVWIYTSWVTNWLDPAFRPVQIMLLVLMFLGMILSASIPAAFAGRGLAFAGAYIAIQLGRTLFMLWAVRRHDSGNFRNMLRIAVWLAVSGVFWILGALADQARIGLWLVALGFDFVGPALGFFVPGLGHSETADWEVDSYHLAERCAGFILIALGESLTVIGETFYSLRWNAVDTAAFPAAFLGAAALWWIYFDNAAERNADAFAESHDPGAIARAAYTYVHGLLVAAIIIVAAGDYLVLEHPGEDLSISTAALLIGGPALYLAANGVFRRLLHPHFPQSHIVGLLLLAVLALATPFMTTMILIWAVAAALGCVMIYSDILLRRLARR